MPATAGRVRMPANNRVHSSAALQTHGIWQSAIGYDPYAPTNKDDGKRSVAQNAASAAEPDAENAYASFQGLLALAKITNSNSDEARGACKRCGRVGHLYVNCKNFLSLKDGARKDDELIPEVILERLKGEKVKKRGESSDSDDDEEEDSESSDSDYDSEIERILAEKARKSGGKVSRDKDVVERGRSKKRRGGKREDDSDSEDEGRKRKRRKEKRRDDSDESSDEEKRTRRKRKSRKERRRRRSHRLSSDDDDSSEASPDERRRHKRRSKRADSDSGSDSDDHHRVGRDKKRRRSVKKKSRKSRHGDDN